MLPKKLLQTALFAFTLTGVSALYALDEAQQTPTSYIESEEGQQALKKTMAMLDDMLKMEKELKAELQKVEERLANPEIYEALSDEDKELIEGLRVQILNKLEKTSAIIAFVTSELE
ncbi:MAG: hypothetical protein SP4CHLAM5_01240 [Chlamydiia bacterium]|nr:hypothetical protein [Chlamydiia bacterium]MCH9618000.1 hypothetical protein [Chlamydiia bacterium]MCH9623675.1 hypothetical protein [Chlamydiia bacterium]